MRVTIMQPAYLPWQGYFQRIMQSDVCVSLDHVKIDWHSKTQFTNRNRVLTINGPVWLTVPLQKADSDGMRINAIRISQQQDWQKKHWGTIRQNYSQAGFFVEYCNFFETFYAANFALLVDAIEQSNQYLLTQLNISIPVVKSSTLKVPGAKHELVLNLCKELGATQYISGPFGREYLNRAAFDKAGIEVFFHDFVPFAYSQRNLGFVPYLSIIDLLFAVGGVESAGKLREATLNAQWN